MTPEETKEWKKDFGKGGRFGDIIINLKELKVYVDSLLEKRDKFWQDQDK